MKRKIIIALIVFLATIAVSALVYLNIDKSNENLSDEEIKAKYCHVTADVRKTDVYCQNPELYRQHVIGGSVIQE